ncbi:adenylate/guanylate cyclase domain-containing protein [Thermodesulfobacteriota bacterium]
MGEDEEATVRTLTTYREVMTTLIQQHRGHVVDSPGDNLLAEFTSVVDAVQCAVSVQKEIQSRNAELPENRRMQFRIGINLGDVIEEGERIYGDGVNIAARLEGLADSGGICISKTAFDQIESKLPYGYEFIGDQTVKNIPKPVGAYRVQMEPRVTVPEPDEPIKTRPWWRQPIFIGASAFLILVVLTGIWYFYMRPSFEPADVKKMANPLPENPSIAVLPFVNLSGDPKQDYIVDGITESIITGLSNVPKMFVIARNSVFRYKGKSVEVRKVSEELGVQYVMEGSVQKEGDRLRINAQLIDAVKGHHLWAEKYDRNLKDLFALQDEITMKVITETRVKLTSGEAARVHAKGTNNIEAYLKVLQADHLIGTLMKENNLLARKLLEDAIDLDPKYPRAYFGLAYTHSNDVLKRWTKSPEESRSLMKKYMDKGIELYESSVEGVALLAFYHDRNQEWDKALADYERAVSLRPDGRNIRFLANYLTRSGRFDEAVAMWEKLKRLDPFPPSWVYGMWGLTYFQLGRYEDALETFKKLLELAKKGEYRLTTAHRLLAATYAMLGQEKEAQYHTAELLKVNPKYSIKKHSKYVYRLFKNKADADRVLNALRKAGLPE